MQEKTRGMVVMAGSGWKKWGMGSQHQELAAAAVVSWWSMGGLWGWGSIEQQMRWMEEEVRCFGRNMERHEAGLSEGQIWDSLAER